MYEELQVIRATEVTEEELKNLANELCNAVVDIDLQVRVNEHCFLDTFLQHCSHQYWMGSINFYKPLSFLNQLKFVSLREALDYAP